MSRTDNPYIGVTATATPEEIWEQGYDEGTFDCDGLKTTQIRDLERQVMNLQEKNDNQRNIIVEAGEQHDIDAIQLEQATQSRRSQDIVIRRYLEVIEQAEVETSELRADVKNQTTHTGNLVKIIDELRAEVLDTRKTAFGDGVLEGRKQGNYKGGWDDGFRHGQALPSNPMVETMNLGALRLHPDNPYPETEMHSPSVRAAWEEGHKHGLAQCNHHPEALTQADAVKFLAEAEERGIAEGERRLEALGAGGAAVVVRAARKEGFEEGRNYGIEEWMKHFILYMQENDQDFAVCKLSDLETMREAVTQAHGSSDMIGDIVDHLGTIDKVLSRLEYL